MPSATQVRPTNGAATAAPPRPAPSPPPEDPEQAREGEDKPFASQNVERSSLYVHVVRQVLLEAFSGREETRRAFITWEDLQRARRRQDVAAAWRKVGRFLVGLGAGADGGYGEAAWRRLYLTEVAPWADYAQGDEYRFLGLAGPGPIGGSARGRDG
jgi:hypothetical protein